MNSEEFNLNFLKENRALVSALVADKTNHF